MNETASPRSVLVTGGSRGIGRTIVERFLADGHRVTCASTSGEAPAGALGVACDVTDAAQVDAAFAAAEEAHGPVTVAVANAGITRDTLILRMSDDDWDAVVDVNLKGAFHVAKRATRSMLRAKGGRLVFIGSVVGLHGTPGQVNYAATKTGLIGMARALTREVGRKGITANVVAPGFIETEMTAVLPEERRAEYLAQIPAGRLGSTDDVAAAVAFLASDQARYISGAVVPVDGGLGMGH
ncbi:3-oxoacyl-ACP reductase FabG [Nigerium massiliense]|uniref:3-oxoacyl-ACP reductase FabG n=1 Tax=Nigerium massiliense TaxID=1522317 RepID=UPI00058B287C|nr:3-oxoacyl-ACP reductase FabG [Nigerium massiliense]